MVPKLVVVMCLVLAANGALAAGRGYVGVTFARLPSAEKQVPSGVIVKKVFPGMAAQQAGLKPGEVVTQINGEIVVDPPSAVALLAQNAAGQKVRLTVIDKIDGTVRRSYVTIVMGNRPTEDFAKIMRVPRPCRLSEPATVRHCISRQEIRRHPVGTSVH